MADVNIQLQNNNGDNLFPKTKVANVDGLNTQTAYSAKGTASKVAQITTNTLGQVTNITEVDINADKVDSLHLNDQAMAYVAELTTTIGIGQGCLAGTKTEAEIFALTGNLYGKFYLASDTNKIYRRISPATAASSSYWRNDTTKYNASLSLTNQLQDESYIYIKVNTGYTYYSKLAKFFVFAGYDNVSGSTTITGYCRQQNKFMINSCNYNGNNLLGVYQPTANTNIYYLKFKRYASSYGAASDYSVDIKVMTNFQQGTGNLEFIGKNHAEYATVSAYNYYTVPADGISSNDIQTINGSTVGTNPKFTDANVTLTPSSGDAYYPITFKSNNTASTETTGLGFDGDTTFSFNPYANNLKVTKINGVAVGTTPNFKAYTAGNGLTLNDHEFVINTSVTATNSSVTSAISTHNSSSSAHTALFNAKQDVLTFDSTPTSGSNNPVKSDGIYTAIEDVREIAEGKTKTFVIDGTSNPGFKSDAGTLTVGTFTTLDGVSHNYLDVKVGDNIYLTDTDWPDRWVSGINTSEQKFYAAKLETAKVPITSIKVNGSQITPVSGAVDIPVPTKTSDLTNDSGFLTEATLPQELYWCTYNTTTYAQITQAVTNNKLPMCKYNGITFTYLGIQNSKHYFGANSDTRVFRVSVDTSNTWGYNHDDFEFKWNKTTTVSSSSTDAQYPSAKSVYTFVDTGYAPKNNPTFTGTVTTSIYGVNFGVQGNDIYTDSEDTNLVVESHDSNVVLLTDSSHNVYKGTVSNANTVATLGDIITPSDATITIKQTGRADQTFTLNGSATTINLDNTTYNDATTSVHGLMSTSDKTKLDGIAIGAEVNVQSDWNQTNTSADDYIKNKPSIPSNVSVTDAAVTSAGNVVTSLSVNNNAITVNKLPIATSVGSTSAQIPTGKAVADYIASRGENLLTNGGFLLNSNYNFTQGGFGSFKTNDAYYCGGCMERKGPGSPDTDEFMAIDPNQSYELSYYVKCSDSDVYHFDWIGMYDIDKLSITASEIMWVNGTETTLTQDLKPGDTIVHVANVSGWQGTTAGYRRGVILWDYKNSKGFGYMDLGYSRYHYSRPGAWASTTLANETEFTNGKIVSGFNNRDWFTRSGSAGSYVYTKATTYVAGTVYYYFNHFSGSDIGLWAATDRSPFDDTNNTITLDNPWQGRTFAAGTKIGQSSSGGTYKYLNSSYYVTTANVWEKKKGTIQTVGLNDASGKFRDGTAFVKVGFLLNYGNRSTTRGDMNNAIIKLSNLSFALKIPKTAAEMGAAPTNHASAADTYGLGAVGSFGHVKIITGDLNGKTHSAGYAASQAHTHSQYYLATNPSGYTSNTGTVTSVAVKMNGSTKGTVTTSGTIDLGTVITAHQDISGKANLAGGNTFTGAQTIDLGSTYGAKLEVTGSGGDQCFLLTRSDGAQCVLEAGGSIGLFGTKTNHPIQVRTNYTNRMTIGTDGSVVLATDVGSSSNDNQVATTKWTNSKLSGKSNSDHTHTTTIAADSGVSQLNLAANTKYKLTAGGTTFIFTTPDSPIDGVFFEEIIDGYSLTITFAGGDMPVGCYVKVNGKATSSNYDYRLENQFGAQVIVAGLQADDYVTCYTGNQDCSLSNPVNCTLTTVDIFWRKATINGAGDATVNYEYYD